MGKYVIHTIERNGTSVVPNSAPYEQDHLNKEDHENNCDNSRKNSYTYMTLIRIKIKIQMV